MPRKDGGKLGGLVRRKLVRELALKPPDVTYSAIAKKYGVALPSLTEFRHRHADEIEAVAKNADDEFAGMLIAQKAFRLAALQELFEKAMTPQPKVSANGKVTYAYNEETGADEMITEVQIGEARQALKQAAEELGQLANRMTVNGDINTTTTYRIVNVTDQDLT